MIHTMCLYTQVCQITDNIFVRGSRDLGDTKHIEIIITEVFKINLTNRSTVKYLAELLK